MLTRGFNNILADDGPKHHASNPSRSYFNLVENISGCLLGEEDDRSDLAKEITSLNAVLEGSPLPKVCDSVSDVLEPWSIEQGETNRVYSYLQHTKTTQQPIDIATSNTQCASHISALVFHHSQSIRLLWQSRSYITSIHGLKSTGKSKTAKFELEIASCRTSNCSKTLLL